MTYSKSCLLIDDDLDDQLVFSLALKIIGNIRCVTSGNGFSALKKLEYEPPFIPDYIFLDLNLPGINGFDFLAKIKSNPKLSHIPVVIYTTSSREEDILKTKKLGAAAFITKPYQISELTTKLKDFF